MEMGSTWPLPFPLDTLCGYRLGQRVSYCRESVAFIRFCAGASVQVSYSGSSSCRREWSCINNELPAILSVPSLRDLPTWSQVREEAARNFHHVPKLPFLTRSKTPPCSSMPPLRPAQLDPVLLIRVPCCLFPTAEFLNLSFQLLVLPESRRLSDTTLMNTLKNRTL